MAIEVGKNRLEALGEVEEAADLLRYYADVFERNDGYDHPMDNLGDPAVHTRSILRPFGVFAVISPFNFPMALAAGPTAGALAGGNTVVFKPASAGAMTGVPPGRGALATRASRRASSTSSWDRARRSGEELQENPGIDGIVFTGSFEVGFALFRTLLHAVPPALHRGDGRQEPGHRHGQGGPRGGGRGDHAVGLRLRRPEVLRQQPRLRGAAGPRRARPPAGPEDREDHDRRPAGPRELAGPAHRRARRASATRRPSRRRAGTAASTSAAST